MDFWLSFLPIIIYVLLIILLVIGRLDKKKILYTWYKRIVAKKVGIRAAKMAVKENYDLVFSFDNR